MHSVTNQVSATALLRAHSPRLRAACVAPWLSCHDCASCAGEILCLHAPAPLSKVRAIARIWISRVNGNIISSFPDSIAATKVRGLASHLAPALAHLHDRPWSQAARGGFPPTTWLALLHAAAELSTTGRHTALDWLAQTKDVL